MTAHRSDGPERSSAFQAWIDDARKTDIAAMATRLGARLRRSGRELIGPCPACGGTDRFSINPAKGVFHCRGSGRSGDVIELTAYVTGERFLAVCEIISGRPSPDHTPSDKAVRGQALKVAPHRQAAAKANRRKNDEVDAARREAERTRAYQLWRSGRAIIGSHAAAYLAERGIAALEGVRLRFLDEVTYWCWSDTKAALIPAGRYPAMIAPIVSPFTGRFLACHLTYLEPQLPLKAAVRHPETGETQPARKVRGPKQGGVIALAGDAAATRLRMGEGIETTLTDHEMRVREGWPLDGLAWWAGIDLFNIGGPAAASVPHPAGVTRTDRAGQQRVMNIAGPDPDLARPGLELPDRFSEIILLGDRDSDPWQTEFALKRAAKRWRKSGRRTLVYWASANRDLNDMWRAQLAGEPP